MHSCLSKNGSMNRRLAFLRWFQPGAVRQLHRYYLDAMNGAKAHAHLNHARYQHRLLVTKDRSGFAWYHNMGDPHPGMLVCLEEATNEEILQFIQNLPSLASGGRPCEIEAQQE
jgi:hypothetical protein